MIPPQLISQQEERQIAEMIEIDVDVSKHPEQLDTCYVCECGEIVGNKCNACGARFQ